MARRLMVQESGVLVEEQIASKERPTDEVVPGLTMRERIVAYFMLTKPRIIELLLITTVPPMIVAEGGMPSLSLIFFTLLGGALSAGGAGAINCYVDRDIDELMTRTRKRPLPQHKVRPRNAVDLRSRAGRPVLLPHVGDGEPSVGLARRSPGCLFYVFVYSIAMKRTTPQNIVIGGAAGAVPALVGWSAVTGTVELPALALFAIIFYWTPPHFWALSLRYEKEYAAAGVPMMPVVYGKEETAKHILLYSFLLFAMCLVFFSVGKMGYIYLGSADRPERDLHLVRREAVAQAAAARSRGVCSSTRSTTWPSCS